MRVFISYAWESDEFKDDVWNLAGWLENNSGGEIKVSIDRYFENRPPESGWPIWMQNEIDAADIVLIVCSPKYRERFEKNNLDAPGGAGVVFEGTIITQQLYNAKMKNSKFFPILPENGETKDIPALLQAFNNNHKFPSGNERILKLIFNDNPKHLAEIVTAVSKTPPETKNGVLEQSIVEDIVHEINSQEVNSEKKMLTPIQIIVRSFLSLGDNAKIDISKKLTVYMDDFNNLAPMERDKAIFKLIKEQNLLHELWNEINEIIPFENNNNPFKKVNNELHS